MEENKKPENPSAFPLLDCADGMTLRDYFAAKAMQGILTNQEFLKTILKSAPENSIAKDAIAKTAYTMADGMLKQREL
jgi:hypothetical protein